MPDNRKRDLCKYRMDAAEETFEVAEECLKGAHYKMPLTVLIMRFFMR